MNVIKVTLGTGKTVLLRELLIKHQDLAAQAAGSKVGSGNELAMGIAIQKELLKLLLVQVDGKDLKPMDVEDLDKLFTFAEYGQLLKVLGQLVGESSSMGNFQLEFSTSGGT